MYIYIYIHMNVVYDSMIIVQTLLAYMCIDWCRLLASSFRLDRRGVVVTHRGLGAGLCVLHRRGTKGNALYYWIFLAPIGRGLGFKLRDGSKCFFIKKEYLAGVE